MSNYFFEIIKPTDNDWALIEGAYDSTCYQTREWYSYFDKIGVRAFVVRVMKNNEHIGYFMGEKIWLPFPIIAAPIEGIGTYTQGLNMLVETSAEQRIEIYQSLAQWVFENNIALSLQVEDWCLRIDTPQWIPMDEFHHATIEKSNIQYTFRPTLYVALNRPIEELWAATSYSSCKYCVHKAQKRGLYVREITNFEDIEAFCHRHYNQLHEVCARKGTRPKLAQKEFRMRALCESLFPDRVLMLECVGKDENGVEQVMSTGIFCIDKGQSAYWTGASYQRYQKNCPNELMVWEAMCMLHERGTRDFNMCGSADYKLKFGTIYAYVPRLLFAKYSFLVKYTDNLKWMWRRVRHNTLDVIVRFFNQL